MVAVSIFDDRPICDDCGDRILNEKVHPRVCDPDPTFDGECPMCGEDYTDEGYIQHLEECPGES